ncbi:hypothetical protein NQ315_005840 [Exocentrus adspersus]|uniref:Tubulin polyglutamylase TTLL4 n=1 Tax=Exocentrus adspersus TaxID=1586481 RepID=A0AAV8VR07_9CUCU|nr:hypothetical protein NQ315_005840 [Exocentrus adspersus]
MGDCNLSHYTGLKHDEKVCKYSYSSWCSTCEKNSPRRRSRSETNEPCRRRCKEMKTLSKKHSRSREYENMEFEYEIKEQWQEKDVRYECCRVRSNLCELPTSYISNNCQVSVMTGIPKMSNETGSFVDCLRSVTSYEETLKFVNFDDKLENLGTMQEKSKVDTYNRISPNKLDYIKNAKRNDIRSSLANGYVSSKNYSRYFHEPLSFSHNDLLKDNHYSYKNSNIRTGDLQKHYQECCPLIDFKLHDLSDRKPLCYDTGTYFDKRIDSSNLHERYSREVEYLREKLKLLKNKSLPLEKSSITIEKLHLDAKTPESPQQMLTSSVINLKQRTKKERKIISPPLVKNVRSRVTLKTRTKSAKLKKHSILSTSDCNESEYSGTDSENEITLDEDLNSLSESVTDDSHKDYTENVTTVSLLGPLDAGSGDSINWPIRPSLFPNIPPYIHFNTHDSEDEFKVPNGRKFFKWKLSTITPVVVRKTLTNSGFALVRKSNQWLGTWGKHMKSPMFKTLKETQKLNHFPGTFQLGRKDRLWRNFQKMINKFGYKEFGFLPHTYVLPQELKLLKQNWEFKNGNGGEMWIIKPPASARGVGIKVINKWSQLPKKTSLVVQKYISDPYLINGSKFDLRLYVLVTSFHPLRIYLYPDGLARFASAKYSDDAKDLKDRYMHLTNYSINKLSSQYTANEDANACQGHKWTISKLMEFLDKNEVDTKALWKNLEQLVIKTIIACEAPITQLCEENMNNHYNCYELFGIDVLLDSKLKPWLLEVNISPSLHSASPLDAYVKGPLVKNLFDMAQFHLPPRLGQTIDQCPQCFDPKLYTLNLTKKEKHKQISFSQFESREDYLYDILRDLTGDDVRHLVRAEDEYVVKGKFERIFPTAHTHKYLNFMEPRYYNRLFDAWETKYAGRKEDGIELLQTLCSQKVHLKVAPPNALRKNSQNMIHSDTSALHSKEVQSRLLEERMQKASIVNDISAAN